MYFVPRVSRIDCFLTDDSRSALPLMHSFSVLGGFGGIFYKIYSSCGIGVGFRIALGFCEVEMFT